MESANELLGFLHGAYGLGVTISPIVATAMVTKGNRQWYTFYYVMLGLSGLELILTTSTFWGATAEVHRESIRTTSGGTGRTTRRTPGESHSVGCLLPLAGICGWVVTFMLKVRNADAFSAGLTATFFWLGLTIGRIVLGFFTGRISEKLAITIYLMLSIGLQLMYWLIPNLVASAVCVASLGFLQGPLFPTAIVAATKLCQATIMCLPSYLPLYLEVGERRYSLLLWVLLRRLRE